MKKKIVWSIVIILSIVNVIIDYAYFNTIQADSLISEIYDFVFVISIPLITGLIISAILAFIPFRKSTYEGRLTLVLPFVVMIVVGLYTYSTAALVYYKEVHGRKLSPITYFRAVEIPEGVDCSEVKEGVFETDNLIIERRGNIQVQTNKKTGEKTSFDVNWLSDCEYYLTSNSEKNLKVKIVEVDDEGYDCYVAKGISAQKNRVDKAR